LQLIIIIIIIIVIIIIIFRSPLLLLTEYYSGDQLKGNGMGEGGFGTEMDTEFGGSTSSKERNWKM